MVKAIHSINLPINYEVFHTSRDTTHGLIDMFKKYIMIKFRYFQLRLAEINNQTPPHCLKRKTKYTSVREYCS